MSSAQPAEFQSGIWELAPLLQGRRKAGERERRRSSIPAGGRFNNLPKSGGLSSAQRAVRERVRGWGGGGMLSDFPLMKQSELEISPARTGPACLHITHRD